MRKSFSAYTQPDAMECGPACLRMVSEHYGKRHMLEHLRENCFVGRDGVSMLGISRAAESLLDLQPHSLKFCIVLYSYCSYRWLSDDYVDDCS